jgi:hypothetical protein
MFMRLRRILLCVFSSAWFCLSAFVSAAGPLAPAAPLSDRFAVVFIDKDTEAKLGAFPLPRTYFAQAVRQAAALHARAVVFKFFFDQSKNPADDLAFAESMTNLPIALEARLDDNETHPNPLPARFSLALSGNTATAISGQSGWIPLPLFTERAASIGFVDFDNTNTPLLETFQQRQVKSLLLCCLELAEGRPAQIHPGQDVVFGALHLPLDRLNRCRAYLPARDDCPYIPFHRFLSGDVPSGAIAGKVVIIGYDGDRIHSIPSPLGPIRAHRFFVYVLESLCHQLRP